MTSENESNVVPTMKVDDEIIREKQDEPIDGISSKNQDVSETIADIDESIEPKEENNVDKRKRVGRKQREPSDMKLDLEMIDTPPLFEQPIILEGKRSRKPTSRLELAKLTTPKKEFAISQGHGKALSEIAYINYQITHASTDALSRMCTICFGRRVSKTNVRKNLRDFQGFEFNLDSDEYQRHLSNLTKLKKDQLRSLSDILGLSSTGRNTEHAERILQFLMEPTDQGKPIPERKASMRSSKKFSTNSKESIPTDDDDNSEENIQNSDDDLFDDYNETGESDEDYIDSDEDIDLTINDDPDDFVYQPGKKAPKRKSSLKRSRSSTSTKRKRGSTTRSKHRGKKANMIIDEKKTNDETSANHEDNSSNRINEAELKSNDEPSVTVDIKAIDETTDKVDRTTSDIVPTTR